MKKLLLLDADVIIDLHTLALFEKICRTYLVHATKTVIREAAYFKRGGKTERIEIAGNKVSIIDDVDLASSFCRRLLGHVFP